MCAGCSEQSAPGAGGRADAFFDALRKYTVARAVPADDRLREVVAIACCDLRPIEEDHILLSLGVNPAAIFPILFCDGNS